MNVRFYVDPDTGLPHIYGHGVTEEEVEDALADRREDRAGKHGARIALGRTGAGRQLRVIYAPDRAGAGVFVITAYELRGKALAAYRRRRRRKK